MISELEVDPFSYASWVKWNVAKVLDLDQDQRSLEA